MKSRIYLAARLEFRWDDVKRLWWIRWIDSSGKPLGGPMKIDTSAPLDAWARRQIAIKVGEHFYADLAAEWRD